MPLFVHIVGAELCKHLGALLSPISNYIRQKVATKSCRVFVAIGSKTLCTSMKLSRLTVDTAAVHIWYITSKDNSIILYSIPSQQNSAFNIS